MIKKLISSASFICLLFFLVGCKKIIDSVSLNVGSNSVTTNINFSDDFDFDVSNSVDIDIKDVNYGTVGIDGATDDKPFSAYLTANLDMFYSQVWEGFAPVTTLPNDEPLPRWITPNDLVRFEIPNFSKELDLAVYVGYHKPYYIGIALGLKILDEHFPEGLALSQALRISKKLYGQAIGYGPKKDSDGSIIKHGGLFVILGFGTENIDVTIDKFKKNDFKLHNF